MYEVDRPGTQTIKQARIQNAGLAVPASLRFVPVDFETTHLEDGLSETDFDRTQPAFFSWLGVTMYLDYQSIQQTLRAVCALSCPGSSLVFDYIDRAAFAPDGGSKPLQALAARLERIGQPIYDDFQATGLASELSQFGLALHENLSPAEIHDRYLSLRTDGYRATEFAHFALAHRGGR